MGDKEILILIEKLRSKTISSEELKRLRHIVYTADNSKELLELMREEFEHAARSSETLPDYTHSHRVMKRLEQSLQPHRKGKARFFYWAASVTAACVIMGLVFFASSDRDTPQDMIWETVSTKHGERKRVVLSDGTSITLNGNTSITYPRHILDNLRLVRLEGEAFFDIAKNEERPFLVISKDFTTQVVGTSFNIDSDIGKVVEVNTGQVNVFALSDQEAVRLVGQGDGLSADVLGQMEDLSTGKISLVKGQKAQLGGSNHWAISDYHYKNWLDNELVHLNEPIHQVVKKAYRNFGDSIAVHSSLADKNITITFRGRTKEQVLHTLAELCNGTLTLNQTKNIWEIKK